MHNSPIILNMAPHTTLKKGLKIEDAKPRKQLLRNSALAAIPANWKQERNTFDSSPLWAPNIFGIKKEIPKINEQNTRNNPPYTINPLINKFPICS